MIEFIIEGPHGAGKSTLAKQYCRDFQVLYKKQNSKSFCNLAENAKTDLRTLDLLFKKQWDFMESNHSSDILCVLDRSLLSSVVYQQVQSPEHKKICDYWLERFKDWMVKSEVPVFFMSTSANDIHERRLKRGDKMNDDEITEVYKEISAYSRVFYTLEGTHLVFFGTLTFNNCKAPSCRKKYILDKIRKEA
ncbi:AAA domain containing protein [uncultured Caudovirales phage]|uniref:AAA domain containing protein n=1 Tax=uncultured Caudovirales phage TaxID=2100421 RepID=A0A6J5KZW0_9CAUD|nr:AAA domain containing protein [uncultured Caudovirales phage]